MMSDKSGHLLFLPSPQKPMRRGEAGAGREGGRGSGTWPGRVPVPGEMFDSGGTEHQVPHLACPWRDTHCQHGVLRLALGHTAQD